MHKQTVAYQIQRWHVHGARFVFSTYKRRGYVNSDTFYTWKRAKLTSSRTINGKMTSREQRSQQQKCFVPPSPLPRERATITATPTTCRTVIFTRYLAVRMRASRIGHDSAANPIQPSVRHRFWRVVWRTTRVERHHGRHLSQDKSQRHVSCRSRRQEKMYYNTTITIIKDNYWDLRYSRSSVISWYYLRVDVKRATVNFWFRFSFWILF